MNDRRNEPLGQLLGRSPCRRTVLKALLGGAAAAVVGGCAASPGPVALQGTTGGTTGSQAGSGQPPGAAAGAPGPRAEQAGARLPASHFIQRGPVERPNVAITVDDFFTAAGADYLAGLLSLAQQKNVRFTFFPTGQALDDHAALGRAGLWQQAVADGHVIGNHTYHHPLPRDAPGRAASPPCRPRT